MIKRELAMLSANGLVINANLAICISPDHARWFDDPCRLIQIIDMILKNELVIHEIFVLLEEFRR